MPNPYLDYLIDPSFQGVNRLFVSLFEISTNITVHTGYYLSKVEIKDDNVMIDGQNFFNQLVKNNLRTYEIIRKIAADQGDDYTNGCVLYYNYFNEYYKMMAIDLSKQQALDADTKAIQQIDFTGNLNRGKNDQGQDINDNTTMFFIIEEAKEINFDFSQGTVKVL